MSHNHSIAASSHAPFPLDQLNGNHRSSKSTRHTSSSRASGTCFKPLCTVARNDSDAHDINISPSRVSPSRVEPASSVLADANALLSNVSSDEFITNPSPNALNTRS